MNLHPLGNPKIALSEAELRLVENADWILTKNGIIDKVYALFGELAMQYRALLEDHAHLPSEILTAGPKIAKGEKYDGLPWVMLDYPRSFGREGHFAIRTFFWWGHFFSIRIQLSGKYFDAYIKQLLPIVQNHAAWQAGITVNPWDYHLPCNHLGEVTQMENLSPNEYFIASAWLPLQQWGEAGDFLKNRFEDICRYFD